MHVHTLSKMGCKEGSSTATDIKFSPFGFGKEKGEILLESPV
jgi:hypothetical protein